MSSILLTVRSNRSILSAAATELAAKLLALLPTATFTVNGAQVTSAQLQTQLEAYVTAVQATNTARASLHDFVVAEANALALIKASVRALFAFVVANYGEASTIFSALGFTPTKKGKKSAASKAEAVERGKATREARGTLGKRQKASIHGTAPATATPAPATPTPTPAATEKPTNK